VGAADRRIRERQDMKSRILTAAADLIREEGYEKLTIRKVADRIEYSPMALYNHFSDKDAILKELAEEGLAKFLSAAPGRSSLSPLDELRRYMLGYIHFAIKNPEEYRLIFMTQRGPLAATSKVSQTVDHVPEGNGRLAFARLVECVSACGVEYDVFQDVFAVALFLWTGIHGASSLLITLTKFPFGTPKHYAESTVKRLLSGVIAASPQADSETKGKPHRKVSIG
jgi:AcrR family transcriptional regulator